MKVSPRILFVGNFLTRHWGNGRSGIDMRLMAGAIRNNCQVLGFSERDIARFLAPLGFLRSIGAKMMNTRLVKTAKNWKPDFIFLSHCDYVANETLERIHEILPGVKIVHLNCDAVEQAHTRAQIARRMESCDAIFVTSAGPALDAFKTPRNVVGYFPNPCDPSFEVFDNSRKSDFAFDLFFAGRPREGDPRRELVSGLLPLLDKTVKFGLFGLEGRPLVVGRAYEEAILVSKMGLSANSFEGVKWYASDRLGHLMANGLLTFQHAGNQMQRFFSEKETVYYETAEELAEKIRHYNCREEERRAVAAAGRAKYYQLFEARRVLNYLLEATLGEAFSEPYEWAEEVRR